VSEISTGHAEGNAGPGSREGKNLFARIGLFVREVVSELKRVVTPSADETRRYTIIVLIFVIVITVSVTLMDLGFGKLAALVFGTDVVQ
jgi:preprotein translocase subunit SecE